MDEVKIEIKLSFLEDTVAELSKTVALQDKRIEKLEAENTFLNAKLTELREAAGEEIPNRPPPHY
jgi:uncharacterized coiled-coil protein SlyX